MLYCLTGTYITKYYVKYITNGYRYKPNVKLFGGKSRANRVSSLPATVNFAIIIIYNNVYLLSLQNQKFDNMFSTRCRKNRRRVGIIIIFYNIIEFFSNCYFLCLRVKNNVIRIWKRKTQK